MKIAEKVFEGIFLNRVTRFSAYVKIGKKKYLVFVPNPSPLSEILQKGKKVVVRKIEKSEGRKSSYDLIFVKDKNHLISIDSRLPNKIFLEAVRNKQLKEFSHYFKIIPEYKFYESKFDFLLIGKDKCFVETKSCSLVIDGVAKFPDAPTERGRKHLKDLMLAKKKGFRASLVFIIQRSDARAFSPYDEVDAEFGKLLRKAVKEGVEVLAYVCKVQKRKISLKKKVEVRL
ncbi:MAG: DNA/RNA nuclease SfsA [Candidatus Aenigmatarchaeota archaeon]